MNQLHALLGFEYTNRESYPYTVYVLIVHYKLISINAMILWNEPVLSVSFQSPLGVKHDDQSSNLIAAVTKHEIQTCLKRIYVFGYLQHQ